VLRIFAHEYLFTGLPRGLPDPALIVVDEAFALRAARRTSLGLDRLAAQRAGMRLEREAEIYDVAVRVRDLLERGEDPRGAADADGFARVAQLEADVADEEFVWPSMKWAEQKRARTLRKGERFKLAALWRVLRDEAGRPGPLQRVELRRNERIPGGEQQDRVHVWWRAAVKARVAPLLLLDAGLDERHRPQVLPPAGGRDDRRPAQRRGGPGRRHRLLPQPAAELRGRGRGRAGPRRQPAGRRAPPRRGRGRGRRDVLLVTYKAAEERLGPIPGVDVAHFGRLRGLDRYRDHDTIVVAGREQPPPAEVEGLARSLFGDDEEPLVLTAATRPRPAATGCATAPGAASRSPSTPTRAARRSSSRSASARPSRRSTGCGWSTASGRRG
jgi:hypothetical protein